MGGGAQTEAWLGASGLEIGLGQEVRRSHQTVMYSARDSERDCHL